MLLAGPNGVASQPGQLLVKPSGPAFVPPLLLTHASLSGCGLLSALAAKLGKRATFRREANLALIEAAVAELGKVVPLIVLDEAQGFACGSLEEVRLLLGLNLADPPAFVSFSSAMNICWAPCACVSIVRSLRIACHFGLSPWPAPRSPVRPAEPGRRWHHPSAVEPAR